MHRLRRRDRRLTPLPRAIQDHPFARRVQQPRLHRIRLESQIGIDPRPQQRGAHNLYLESLAETGVLGALAFFAVLALALTGAWRARSRLAGPGRALGEGLVVALCAFLFCALTLNSAYARYQWIFLGLGLAAGRLARRPAR